MKEEPQIKNSTDQDENETKNTITYKIQEKPPALMSFLLGFQQFLTMIGGCIAYPYIGKNNDV